MCSHLESGAIHEIGQFLFADCAWLALLAGAEWAGCAVAGRFGSILGFQAGLAELVPARGTHWHSQHLLAQGAEALGEAP